MWIFLKELSFPKKRTSLNRENENETKTLKKKYLFQNSMKIKEINSVSLMGHRSLLFSNISFCSRDIQVFKVCKLAK